ncbi:MAG: PTS sugar transporter subunit IIA [Propionibacteriaceae bacterium]|jgi:mannitol/fructose-specific phosphotransferase system IIA component|nr:PTS sugar transporter subunit IIA [Propionibacteriaceae bacterium]
MEMLQLPGIVTGLASEPPEAVIRRAGRLLVELGYVEDPYVEAMITRNQSFSVAIGNLIAIPHGEMAGKGAIRQTGLVVLTYPDGIDWDGEPVKLAIGIAADGNEHLDILERIVEIFDDQATVERVATSASPSEIAALILAPSGAAA